YCAAVMDAYSRRIVGWSMADNMRSELVCDALGMAIVRRQPADGQTILHSDHGSQYTSWAFGQRLRNAGLLGSMGTVGDCYDCEHHDCATTRGLTPVTTGPAGCPRVDVSAPGGWRSPGCWPGEQ